MKKISEASIQSSAVTWFRNNYCLKHHNPRYQIFSIPNEVAMEIRAILKTTRLPERIINSVIATIVQRFKNTGLLNGVSDTIVVLKKKVIFVEFKTEYGTQQENQKQFQKAVTDLEHEYAVVRSLEEFKCLINSHIN